MTDPRQLGRGAAFASGAAGGALQRRLRRMSGHPEEPRVFSQAKILVPVGLLTSLAMTLVMYVPISDYAAGRSDDVYSVIVPGAFTVTCYVLLAHGLFRRFGVDRDKVWTRFGRLFYREIRFEDVDRLSTGVERFKLYAGGTLVNIDYNRFDYSLAYVRVLEELQHRRFTLKDVEADDPEWEGMAQTFRNILASRVRENHRGFYEAHPEELDRLEALVRSPHPPVS